jgi:CheY-like chemotaxis protein
MPHLVLVDDDDLFRESPSLNLIDEGYQVTSFGNGREALAYLEGGGDADGTARLAHAQPDRPRSAALPAARRG